jgi:beta-phosphoglucomutase-like phosphatase (HAD superfamily)
VFPGSLRYVRATGAARLRRAVVSSSTNAHAVLVAAGIIDDLAACIIVERDGLKGKPRRGTYLAAALVRDGAPAPAAVCEDALAGVEAGRAGGFGFVVGVDRAGRCDAFRELGTVIVVNDLADRLDQP